MTKTTTKKSRKSKTTKGKTPVTKNQLGRLVRNYVTGIQEHKWWSANVMGQINAAPFAGEYSKAAWVWRCMMVEYNNTLASAPLSATSSAHIDQGTTAFQRVGSRIKLHGFEVVINFNPRIAGQSISGSMCRCVITHDKMPGGNLPTATSPLQTNNIWAVTNNDYRDKFTILEDFVHTFVPTATNVNAISAAGPMGLYRLWIPAKSVVEFDGNSSGDWNHIVKNGFYIGFCSDADDCCLISCKVKTVWIDG